MHAEYLRIRGRLRNPPGGIDSSEIEILSEAGLRRAASQRRTEQRHALHEAALQRKIAVMRGLATGARRPSTDSPEPPMRSNAPLVREIVTITAGHFGVPVFEILTRRRNANRPLMRQIAMHLARSMTPRTFTEIGTVMDNRDHTTVMFGYYKIMNLIMTDEKVARDVAEIRRKIEERNSNA